MKFKFGQTVKVLAHPKFFNECYGYVVNFEEKPSIRAFSTDKSEYSYTVLIEKNGFEREFKFFQDELEEIKNNETNL